MLRRSLVIAVAVAVLGAAAGTAVYLARSATTAVSEALPAKGHAQASSAAKALTLPLERFGLALLQRQARTTTTGNVVISPASLHAVLSMVLNGAHGQTAAQMRRTLGVDSLPEAGVNQGWADLIWLSQSGRRPGASLADSLWLRAGVPFRQAFLAGDRDYFAAETHALPTDPSAAAAAVNEWVAQHTAGRITGIVTPDSFDAQSILALFNTVSLTVRWSHFAVAATRAEPFTLSDGQQVSVPMMQATNLHAPVVLAATYDAVDLSTSGPVDAWLMVPRGRQTAAALLDGLNAPQLEALYSRARVASGTLALPRFTTTYTAQHLANDLGAMGMPRAFSPNEADLSGIANVPAGRIYIQKVAQKTFVDFSEKGVQAAAGSGAAAGVTALPLGQFAIRADRPFLFVLTAKATGAPLFMGLVRDPR